MIELCGIHKTLGGRAILGGLDLAVAPGECVAIAGPSGAGKTTLLRIVAGLETPDAGSVRLRGCDAAPLAPHARLLGFQFQDSSLWPHMTLAGNIAFGCDGSSRRVEECLDRAGLAALALRKPSEVSGGEARRAGLARALAPRRNILLLDEPLSNLEPALQARMAAWIREELLLTGAACLWVAHDPREAEGVAGRVLALENGRLISRLFPLR